MPLMEPAAALLLSTHALWSQAPSLRGQKRLERLLRRHWPRILAAQLGFVGQSLRHFREPAARSRLRGQWAGLVGLPRMLRKRRTIQGRRRVEDGYVEKMLAEAAGTRS